MLEKLCSVLAPSTLNKFGNKKINKDTSTLKAHKATLEATLEPNLLQEDTAWRRGQSARKGRMQEQVKKPPCKNRVCSVKEEINLKRMLETGNC